MSPAALLADLRARGVTLTAKGDRLRVEAPAGVLTPALRAVLVEQKPALMGLLTPPPADPELAPRVAAFRAQLAAWVASGRCGVPVLTLPDAPEARLGQCVSCATPIPADRFRCDPCRQAVELALGLGA